MVEDVEKPLVVVLQVLNFFLEEPTSTPEPDYIRMCYMLAEVNG